MTGSLYMIPYFVALCLCLFQSHELHNINISSVSKLVFLNCCWWWFVGTDQAVLCSGGRGWEDMVWGT